MGARTRAIPYSSRVHAPIKVVNGKLLRGSVNRDMSLVTTSLMRLRAGIQVLIVNGDCRTEFPVVKKVRRIVRTSEATCSNTDLCVWEEDKCKEVNPCKDKDEDPCKAISAHCYWHYGNSNCKQI